MTDQEIKEISAIPMDLVEEVVWNEIRQLHRDTEAAAARLDRDFGKLREMMGRKHLLMLEFEKLRIKHGAKEPRP